MVKVTVINNWTLINTKHPILISNLNSKHENDVINKEYRMLVFTKCQIFKIGKGLTKLLFITSNEWNYSFIGLPCNHVYL